MLITLVSGCGRMAPAAQTTDNGTGFEINADVAAPAAEMSETTAGMAYESYAKTDAAYDDAYAEEFNTEEYNRINENGFQYVSTNPLSTFAADVDTGSYCNLRRMINEGYGYYVDDIPSGAVRTEEMINYFDYELLDENVTDGKFSVQYYVANCPWNEDNKLLTMTVTANDDKVRSAGNNFVYLIDSSGSMYSEDKLDLAIEGFKRLTKALDEDDIVSIVTYAGNSDVLIEGCEASNYRKIAQVLDTIQASGGTNGSGGIESAYDCALRNYIENGNNRVIIASDGDMNLGITSQSGLVDLIKEKKESGVFLTTLGFGSGNYSDANMEQIADAGNGNYYYIDCIEEADHVLVDKLMQTTVTVAKDVKFQAEFNPAMVSEYRLIGYENRTMSTRDFEDDTKDGGEVGAGPQVTVVYELVPSDGTNGKKLKYQENEVKENNGDILTLSIRYKHPKKDKSELEEYVVTTESNGIKEDWTFIAGLTELSLVLRNSEYKGSADLEHAVKMLKKGVGHDELKQDAYTLFSKLSFYEDEEDPEYEGDLDYDDNEDEQSTLDRTVDLYEN